MVSLPSSFSSALSAPHLPLPRPSRPSAWGRRTCRSCTRPSSSSCCSSWSSPASLRSSALWRPNTWPTPSTTRWAGGGQRGIQPAEALIGWLFFFLSLTRGLWCLNTLQISNWVQLVASFLGGVFLSSKTQIFQIFVLATLVVTRRVWIWFQIGFRFLFQQLSPPSLHRCVVIAVGI